MKTYKKLAATCEALQNCEASNNVEWIANHRETLLAIMATAPSGSGIDCGTKLAEYQRNPEKIVLACAFHHMNDGGMYDGWTEHKVIVTPSLGHEFRVKITGKDRNQIKDYLVDAYAQWLDSECGADCPSPDGEPTPSANGQNGQGKNQSRATGGKK